MHGASYTALGQLLSYAVRFGSTLILTRLLAPDLMGLMTVGGAINYALILFSDVGLRSAIIQNPRGDDQDYRDTVWMVTVLRGVLVALLALTATGIVWLMQLNQAFDSQSAYSDPRLLIVIPLLGLAELIKGTESIELLRAERLMNFRTVVTAQVVRQVSGTTATIVWAWLDPGVLSLCAGPLTGNLVVVLLSYGWLTKGRMRLTWRPADMLAVATAGKWLLVSSVLTFLVSAFDKVYLASRFDASALGLYGIAATLGLLGQELVYRINGIVLFPLLSARHRESPATLKADYYAARRGIEFFSVATSFVLLALGSDVIRVLYDPRYHAAGPLLRAFGLLALLMAYLPMSEALLALGRNKTLTIVNAAKLAGLVAGLFIFVPRMGIIGGVHALTLSALVGAVFAWWALRRIGLLDWRREVRYLGMVAVVTTASVLLELGRRSI